MRGRWDSRDARDLGATSLAPATSLGVLRILALPAPPGGAEDAHIGSASGIGSGAASGMASGLGSGMASDAAAETLLGGESIVAIRQPLTTIGRNLRNTVVLLDPAVSREHARLVWEGGTWAVENCSARNPLWVGEREIAPGARASLAPGEALRLGNTLLQLLAPTMPPTAAGELTAGAAPGAESMASGGASGAVGFLDPGITIRFALSRQFARQGRWALAGGVALLVLAVALVALGAGVLAGWQALAMNGVGGALAALTIPQVPVGGAVLLVGARDRYGREPVVLLIAAFAWGALIAIPAALYAERQLAVWLPSLLGNPHPAALGATWGESLLRGLGAGVTEEAVKGAGLLVLLLALRDEFDNVTDGILYGILIGAGFGMVENFAYFAGSARGDLAFLIVGRVILGWLAHSTFTGLFGAGLGFARESRSRRVRLLAPVAGFVAAVALHSLFDFVDFEASAAVHLPQVSPGLAAGALVAVLLDYLPLFAAQALLLWLLLRALRREAGIVREYLAAEVPAGVVTPDEYAILQDATLRARVERHALFAGGPRAYLTARALHQAAIGLAFRKWHVALGDRPKMAPRQPEEVYRGRIAALRGALLRQMAASEAGPRVPPPTVPLVRW